MVGYDPKKKELTNRQILIASSTSGFVARFLLQPIDVIIEPIRNQPGSKYHSLVQTIRLIHHEEGIRAFWKGHLAAQILSISFNAAQVSKASHLEEKGSVNVGHILLLSRCTPLKKSLNN
jgi:solute carrier family 25 (mitochondrial thiamine pyrophosphate transporter), member 19